MNHLGSSSGRIRAARGCLLFLACLPQAARGQVAAPTIDAPAPTGEAPDQALAGVPETNAAPGPGEVITLTGEAPEQARPRRYGIGTDVIRVLPGSANDALKALQNMPGVARVSYGLGGLALRGTSPRDSKVYLDGVEVPILYHFGGLVSFYPSAMLASMELTPGGFGARHGRAQGGIVTLGARTGRSDRWRTASELSLTDASLRADGPGPGGGAWSLGLRRSHIDAVLAAVLSDEDQSLTLAPRYYDGQLRYDRAIGAGERVSVMLFGVDDGAALGEPVQEGKDPEDGQLDFATRFVRAAVRWQRRLDVARLGLASRGQATASATAWLGADASALHLEGLGLARDAVPMGARLDLDMTLPWGTLGGGIDVQGGRFGLDIQNRPPRRPGMDESRDIVRQTASGWHADLGIWLEALYLFREGLISLRPGLRVDHYGPTGEWVVDPRLTVAHRLPGRVTLTESIGVYHQPPSYADLDPVFGNPDLGSSYSVQSSVGLAVALPGGVSLETTAFHDQMHELPVDAVTAATPANDPESAYAGGITSVIRELGDYLFGSYDFKENGGRGQNYGVEVFLRAARGSMEQAGSWLGWISYTHARALRRDSPARFLGYRPYALDQPHVLTALGSVQLTRRWRVGARARYVSGNPITPIGGSYIIVDEQWITPLAGDILSARLPAFFQIDLRVDRTWVRSWGTLQLFLDVQNITNRVNPEGLLHDEDFTSAKYVRGLPVFPSLGLEYRP